MSATALSHPGHEEDAPNRAGGKVDVVVVGGALGGGRSYRLEEGVE